MRDVVRLVERFDEGTVLVEKPVIDHPNEVLVILRLVRVNDNEAAVQAPLDLLAPSIVGMEPKGSGVLRYKFVTKLISGRHRLLVHSRDTVHCIGNTNSVPVDGRRLR